MFAYNSPQGILLSYHQAGPEHSSFQQILAYPNYILVDYALENDFIINGKEMQEGYFRVSKAKKGPRNINALNKTTWAFLTVSVPAKIVKELGIHFKSSSGIFNLAVIRILLSLLYPRKNPSPLDDWMEANINLMLYETMGSKSPNQLNASQRLRWHDAVLVHRAVEMLKNHQNPLLLEIKLADKTGLKRYRFQKACRQLYGISLKEMIYRIKMEETLQMITLSDRSLKEISRLAGFNSYDNFITAFRNYFDVTPALLRKAVFSR